jgi:hypothetical protein
MNITLYSMENETDAEIRTNMHLYTNKLEGVCTNEIKKYINK